MSVTRRNAKRRYLLSLVDTQRDMHGNHVQQLIVNMRLRGLLSPTCNGLGYGGVCFGPETNLDLSMT
jgi:hypothetical protein